jgi:hypothetical protein
VGASSAGSISGQLEEVAVEAWRIFSGLIIVV